MSDKILFVDDEPNILAGFRRQLRGKFEVETCACPVEALEMISNDKEFAVIVSDMQMPKKNGIAFLAEVKTICPGAIRLMLTGNSDQETASRAVNEGAIFRFVNKPVEKEDLVAILEAALEQYHLVNAERELFKSTLSGGVKVLTDILSLLDPKAYRRILALREPARIIATELNMARPWDVELAVMLSNIGSIVVPSVLQEKELSGEELSEEEQEILAQVPEVGQKLLSNIPRLELVAEMVYYQNKRSDGEGIPRDEVKGEQIPVGARILKFLKDLSQLESRGVAKHDALDQLAERTGWYDPDVVAAAQQVFRSENTEPIQETKPEGENLRTVTLAQMNIGCTLRSDVETSDGVLLATAGQVVDETVFERIRNYAKVVGIKEPLLISID